MCYFAQSKNLSPISTLFSPSFRNLGVYWKNIYPCENIMKVKTTKFSTDPKMHCIWSQFAACEIWGWTKLMIREQLGIQLGRVDRQINSLKIKCPQFQSFSSEKAIAYRVLSCKISFSLNKIIHEGAFTIYVNKGQGGRDFPNVYGST